MESIGLRSQTSPGVFESTTKPEKPTSTYSDDESESPTSRYSPSGKSQQFNPHISFQSAKDVSSSSGLLDDINWFRRFVISYFSYFELHFLYFCFIALVGATICSISEGNEHSFVDYLFVAVSACTVTGLSSIDFYRYNIWSQITVLILILLGSQVLMSAVPVLIRRSFYRDQAQKEVAENVRNADIISVNIDEVLERDVTEYRALGLLSKIVLLYYIIVQLTPFIIWGFYLSFSNSLAIVQRNGVNPWWWAFFHSCSAFNNAGLSLFKDNMVQFVHDRCIILILTIIIPLGNVFYPIAMRFIVWTYSKYHKDDTASKYLLSKPRRCFTHMFTARQTRILLIVGLTIIATEFILFLILDFTKSFIADLAPDVRALAGFFQSISTRTAGFNVIDIGEAAKSMQLLWTLLMYLSSYPFIIALRSSSVKTSEDEVLEEDELSEHFRTEGGLRHLSHELPTVIEQEVLDANDEQYETLELENLQDPTAGVLTKVGIKGEAQQLLLRDLVWLFLAIIIICMVEDSKFRVTAPSFDIFGVIFEVMSAYGTVGLSLGYPGTYTSLSAQFHWVSKFVVMLVMLFGRHRGLPFAIDRAVNLTTMVRPKHGITSPIRRWESSPGILMLKSGLTKSVSIVIDGLAVDRINKVPEKPWLNKHIKQIKSRLSTIQDAVIPPAAPESPIRSRHVIVPVNDQMPRKMYTSGTLFAIRNLQSNPQLETHRRATESDLAFSMKANTQTNLTKLMLARAQEVEGEQKK